MIIDGKAIAEDVYTQLEQDLKGFPPACRDGRGAGRRALKLGILVGGSDAATQSFVNIKTRAAGRLGIELVQGELPEGAATSTAVAAVRKLSAASDGVIVQLPLPAGIDTEEVLRAIPKEKDVDGVNPAIVDGERIVIAPVAAAVAEILFRAGINPAGKEAVVVGAGRLVGKPCLHYLFVKGAVARSLVAGDSLLPLKTADIVVLGAGSPGLVKPEHIKRGAVLIDAGTSEAGGKLAGDATAACADIAAVFTPVPGGVGPVAVAMIFKNLFELAQHQH